MEFITIKDAADVARKVGVEEDSTGIFVQAFVAFQGNSIATVADITASPTVPLAARTRRCALRVQNCGTEEVAFKYAANPVYTAGIPDASFIIAAGATEPFYFASDARALHAVRKTAGTSRVLFLEWELP